MSTQPSRPLSAAMVLLVLALFAGCSLLPKAEPKQLEYEGPAQPDLGVEPAGLPIGEVRTRVVALSQDGVVIAEPDGSIYQVGADGETRWTQRSTLDLPGVGSARLVLVGPSADADAGAVVAASYSRDPCKDNRKACDPLTSDLTLEYGIVALSTADGSVLWSKVLIPSQRLKAGDLPPNDFTWGVSVVSATAVAGYVQHGDERNKRTTLGFDPQSGEELWKVDGIQADWAGGDGGDKLLGLKLGRGSDLDYEGHPIVLDARTGEETWRADDLGYWGRAGGAAVGDTDSHGVYTTESRQRPGTLDRFVVDLATGATTSFGENGAVGEDENGPFYAWVENQVLEGGGRVVSTDLPPGEPAGGREPTDQVAASAAVGGYLWTYQASSSSLVAYDRTGARRSEPVPGMLAAVNEDWLVAAQNDGGRLGIYRLTR